MRRVRTPTHHQHKTPPDDKNPGHVGRGHLPPCVAMPPIDYAKWANASYDDDDDDDDRPRKPRVTRLEGPSTITLGAQQPVSERAVPHTTTKTAPTKKADALPSKPKDRLDYSRWDNLDCDDDDDEDADDDDDMEMAPRYPEDGQENDGEDDLTPAEMHKAQAMLKAQQQANPKTTAPAASSSTPSALPHLEALRAKLTRNGADRSPSHLWRQSESEVELSVLLPPGTRAKAVRPELLASDPLDPTRSKQVLVVHQAGGSGATLWEAKLAYPVAMPESAEDLPWEVSDYEAASAGGRRVLRLTLQKESPHGVVVWWERAVAGEEASDTTAFPDRKHAAKAAAHADVWAEATRMFKEKVAQREKVLIDVGGTAGSSGGSEVEDADMAPLSVS